MWQRISARRALGTLPADPRPIIRRIPDVRERSRSAGAPRIVIREPEESWWRAQDDFHDLAPARPTTTVAVLRERDAAAEAVVSRLAQLATLDELLVVYGSAAAIGPRPPAMVAGLRGRLPRHDVVAVPVRHPGVGRRWHSRLDRFLEAGRLPVVVTASACLREVTAEISSYIRADRVLRVFGTAARAEVDQVWQRAEPSVN